MKQRVYIDTSVIGGCEDEVFSEWSLALFDEFKGGMRVAVISDLTLTELESAPENVQQWLHRLPQTSIENIFLNEESENLAGKYIQEGVVTTVHAIDAQHIALATVARVDVLVSWNFRDIVNLNKIRGFNAVNLKGGYPLLEIRSPREVLYGKEV